MTQLCRGMQHPISAKRTLLWRMGILRRYLRIVWNQALSCWRNSDRYRQLLHKNTVMSSSNSTSSSSLSPSSRVNSQSAVAEAVAVEGFSSKNVPVVLSNDPPSDLVPLKISLLGDCRIGKTSFLVRFVIIV